MGCAASKSQSSTSLTLATGSPSPVRVANQQSTNVSKATPFGVAQTPPDADSPVAIETGAPNKEARGICVALSVEDRGLANELPDLRSDSNIPPADKATNPKKAPAEAPPGPEAPVRLLLIEAFSKFTEAVPCYENLPEGSFIDVAIEEYEATCAADAAVISWRWMRPKPATKEAALDPGANPVPTALVEYVTDVAREEGMKYLWLDWCCAPQYPEDLAATMREINRSGKYYATARGFYIWCFASRVTKDNFEHSDYFYRAWTLSERLHRAQTRGALKAKDFLPSFLRGLFDFEVKAVEQWGPYMAELARKATVAIMGGGGRMKPSHLQEIADMVIRRYPMLAQVTARIDGPFRTLLKPEVRAALRSCVTLRAICEWISRPDDTLDDMTGAFGMQPLEFKQMLLQGAMNASRMSMNNFHGELTSMLEDAYALAFQVENSDSAAALLKPVREVWTKALDMQTTESAVSPQWLRRYLVFEAGCSYKAFSAIDLLFAIYKLFGIEDHSYGQEDSLYVALLEKSTATFMSSLPVEPYGWLKELAAISADQEDILSSQLETVANSRNDVNFCVSPGNFGIFFLPSAGPQPRSLTSDMLLTIPELFGSDDYEDVVTMIVGFRMDSSAQWGMKQLCGAEDKGLERVPKEPGEDIDHHLSLRGRKALGQFEDRLHAAIAAQMSDPWEEDCGLFVAVRYGTRMCLTKAVVLRASCGLTGCPEDADAQWTIERIAAFGSEPMKGSSWGIAQSLDLLCLDIASCVGESSSATASFGDCSSLSEDVCPDEDIYDNVIGVPWFSDWTVAFAAGAEPTSSAGPPLMVPADGLEETDSDLDDDADSAILNFNEGGEELIVPEGKTTMKDSEIDLLEKAYMQMVAASFSADSLMIYYNILVRNYVHDSMMAANLEFFTKLCNTYAAHLGEFGAIILTQTVLKQKFEYLAEDLSDAIVDADNEDLKGPAIAALAKLSDMIEENS